MDWNILRITESVVIPNARIIVDEELVPTVPLDARKSGCEQQHARNAPSTKKLLRPIGADESSALSSSHFGANDFSALSS